MGYVTKETHGGIATEYDYFPNGKVKKATYSDGTAKRYVYDQYWNVVWEYDYDSKGKQNRNYYEHDVNGNVTYMQDAMNGTWYYEYDALGRKTAQTDANGHTTRSEYDANGNQIKTIYPNGLTVEMTYDALNRMTDVSTSGTTVVNGETKARKLTVHYEYDALGRVTVVTVSPSTVFSLDNRRLYTAKIAKVKINSIWASSEDIKNINMVKRFSTVTGGKSIKVK